MVAGGREADAIKLLADVLKSHPDHQNSANLYGKCALATDKAKDHAALEGILRRAVAANPDHFDASGVSSRLVSVLLLQGRAKEAGELVTDMKRRWPESFETTVAEAALAKSAGDTGAGAAAARADADEKLHGQYRQVLAERSAGKLDDASALERLAVLAKSGDNLRTALKIDLSRGHLLILEDKDDEARALFRSMSDRVRGCSPANEVFVESGLRLAALAQRVGESSEAYDRYSDVMLGGGAASTGAAVQAAGAYFETLQRDVQAKRGVEAPQWESARDLITSTSKLAGITPAQAVRLELMSLETLSWQNLPEQTIEAVDRFVAKWDGPIWKKEVSTALFFSAESLHKLRRYSESVPRFREVAKRHKGEKHIFPGMDHLPRSLYRAWEGLCDINASDGELRDAAAALRSAYPDSSYNRMVEITTAQLPQLRVIRAAQSARNSAPLP